VIDAIARNELDAANKYRLQQRHAADHRREQQPSDRERRIYLVIADRAFVVGYCIYIALLCRLRATADNIAGRLLRS
jgi:hypothetical protein